MIFFWKQLTILNLRIKLSAKCIYLYIYIVEYKTRTEIKASAVCLNDYNPLLGNPKKNSDHVENSFHNLLNLTKIHFNLSRI